MSRSKFETYDEIYVKLHNRLNQKGPITTNDAWKITKENYNTVSVVFRSIMEIMIKKGAAIKVRNGKWEILKDATLPRLREYNQNKPTP